MFSTHYQERLQMFFGTGKRGYYLFRENSCFFLRFSPNRNLTCTCTCTSNPKSGSHRRVQIFWVLFTKSVPIVIQHVHVHVQCTCTYNPKCGSHRRVQNILGIIYEISNGNIFKLQGEAASCLWLHTLVQIDTCTLLGNAHAPTHTRQRDVGYL